MELKTERLVIREPREGDEESLIKNVNNLNVSEFTLLIPYPYTLEDAEWWINHCIEGAGNDPRESYNFFINLKPSSDVIGGIGLTDVDRVEKSAELGCWLGEKYWRKGIMTEAAKAVLDFAFDKLGLEEMAAGVFEENEKSTGLIKKLGFEYVGVKDESLVTKSTSKSHREIGYILRKEDYKG